MAEKNGSAKTDPRCSEYIHAALLNSKLAPQPKHDMSNLVLIQKA